MILSSAMIQTCLKKSYRNKEDIIKAGFFTCYFCFRHHIILDENGPLFKGDYDFSEILEPHEILLDVNLRDLIFVDDGCTVECPFCYMDGVLPGPISGSVIMAFYHRSRGTLRVDP
jgi:hypothetical protein